MLLNHRDASSSQKGYSYQRMYGIKMQIALIYLIDSNSILKYSSKKNVVPTDLANSINSFPAMVPDMGPPIFY